MPNELTDGVLDAECEVKNPPPAETDPAAACNSLKFCCCCMSDTLRERAEGRVSGPLTPPTPPTTPPTRLDKEAVEGRLDEPVAGRQFTPVAAADDFSLSSRLTPLCNLRLIVSAVAESS